MKSSAFVLVDQYAMHIWFQREESRLVNVHSDYSLIFNTILVNSGCLSICF